MVEPTMITVAAQGANEKEALDQVTGGWFGDGNPPADVIEGAKQSGLRLFRFRLQIECLGEIK